MKNTFANYAFEHFEIASYRALLEMADAAGDSIGPPLLQQTLDEEIRMAEWIDQHLRQNVRRYIEREAKGLKSGV
jgi:ferritin-like metal-binding protein YciE